LSFDALLLAQYNKSKISFFRFASKTMFLFGSKSASASAIAPITGRFRMRLKRDLVSSIGLGGVLGYCFWYGYHKPKMAMFLTFDAENKARILEEEKSWMTENNYSRQ
jgi:hypothetical protein